MNLGSLVYTIRAKNAAFKSRMRESETAIKNLDNRAKTSAQNMKKWGAAITAVSVAVAAASVKMAADFQENMAEVHTLLGPESQERIRQLGEDVKRLSIETGKDFRDLTGGLYQVVSAFGDSADTARILDINARAAAAGIASTTDAINLTSAVTKAYGDASAEAVENVADLAFQTVKLGQTTFPELAGSIGRVTPLASTLNVNIEELFGSFATLTGVTGNAAEVSTQLRGVLQGLLRPSTELREVMNRLGYATGEQMIQAHGLQGTLKLLYDETGRNNEQLGEMFGNVRALTGILPLVGELADDYTQKTQAMYESTGAMNEAFEIQQQNVNAMIRRIRQMVNVALVDIGEKYLPLIERLLQTVLDLPEPVRQTATALAFVATSLGLIVGPLSLIVAYLPQIKTGLVLMAAGFKPFLVGGAIIGGLTAIWTHIERIREETRLLSADLTELTMVQVEERMDILHKRMMDMIDARRRIMGYDVFTEEEAIENLRETSEAFRELEDQLTSTQEHWEELHRRRRELLQHPDTVLGPDPDDDEPDAEGMKELVEVERAVLDDRERQIREHLNQIHLAELEGLNRQMAQIRFWKEEQERLANEARDANIKALQEERRERINLLGEQIEDDEEYRAAVAEVHEDYRKRERAVENNHQYEISLIEKRFLQKRSQAYEEHEENRLRRIEQWEQRILTVTEESLKEQVSRLESERDKKLAQEDVYGAEAARIRDYYNTRIENLEKQHAEEVRRHEEAKYRFMLDIQEISKEEYIEFLNARIEAEEEYSDEWMSLVRERNAVERSLVRDKIDEIMGSIKERKDVEKSQIIEAIAGLRRLKGEYEDNVLVIELIIDAIKRLKAELAELDDEDEVPIGWLAKMFADIGHETEKANQKAQNFTESLSKGLADAIARGKDLSNVLDRLLDQLAAEILQQMVIAPVIGAVMGTAHQGALVTTAGLIRDLPDYHRGGTIRPDERIVKVQTGERILSRDQNEAFERGEYGKVDLEVPISLSILAMDSQDVMRALNKDGGRAVSRAVEQAVMSNDFLRKFLKRQGK